MDNPVRKRVLRIKRKHKYGVSAKEARTYNGTTYHSKMEASRAAELDMLLRGKVIDKWTRQVAVKLGEDFQTVVDFKVTYIINNRFVVGYEEIKGFETPAFKQVRRLWKKYGPAKLQIMKRSGKGWKTEVITPDRMDNKPAVKPEPPTKGKTVSKTLRARKDNRTSKTKNNSTRKKKTDKKCSSKKK